jgi:hypothetical protein
MASIEEAGGTGCKAQGASAELFKYSLLLAVSLEIEKNS